MKLLRMRTLGMFGIGFLAGSRAGNGPWEKAQESVGQLKGKLNGGDTSMATKSGDSASTSTNGDSNASTSKTAKNGAIEGKRSEATPQLTEI